MKQTEAFSIDKDLKEFFNEKKKLGFNKSGLANNIFKESKEYKKYIREKFGI